MLEIVPGSHLAVTPYGAWQAVARADDGCPRRRVLRSILQEAESPLLNLEMATMWSGEASPEKALETLLSLQDDASLEAWPSPHSAPTGALGTTLPQYLAVLSDSGQALLADHQGFCLAVTGYAADIGDALAAVGADILSVAERQATPLAQLGAHLLDGWGNVDAAGVSGLSFWPMHVGRTRLVLAVSGRPRFNQRAFADLVWALYTRYGQMI
ncbi:MAG: hypothetical protein JSR83_15120 [Proteobacteria bacterium]|nr:hypothetical protein [Pseudomonadota bacterium]